MVLSLVPIGASSSVFVARLLRIIRVLRIITVIPAFRHIIDSLIKTIPRNGFNKRIDNVPEGWDDGYDSEHTNDS